MEVEKVHARARRTSGGGHGGWMILSANRGRQCPTDAFTTFALSWRPDQLLTYTMVSINSMALLLYADYFLKGGGARYPYPKEVWTPAGNLGQTPTVRVRTLIRFLH